MAPAGFGTIPALSTAVHKFVNVFLFPGDYFPFPLTLSPIGGEGIKQDLSLRCPLSPRCGRRGLG
jgi:hypothetical protein